MLRNFGRRLSVKVLSVVLALVITYQPVLAGWLSWVGVGCTVVGVGAAVTPTGAGQVIGGALGIVQIVAVFTDAVVTIVGRPGRNQPRAAAGNAPAAFLAQGLAFLDGQFQHLQLQGDNTDSLVIAANEMIDDFNILLADARNGASADQLDFDVAILAFDVDRIANEFDSGGFENLQFNQSDLDQIRQGVGADGLPLFEVQMLRDAGLSDDFISAFGQYVAQTDLTLSTQSISISEMLHETAEGLFPVVTAPDPN